MANASRLFRSFRLPARKPVVRLGVTRLEDRTTPSISVPLNAYVWTQFGPSPISPAADPAATPLFATPGNLTTAGRTVQVINPRPPAGSTPAQVAAFNNTLVATTVGGGVWRSTDAGQTWVPTTDNLTNLTILDRDGAAATLTDRVLRFGAIAAAPTNGNIIWAGQGNPGFTDTGGAIGSPTGFPPGSIFGTAIGSLPEIPGSQNTVGYSDQNFAGRGLLKSTDAGVTWRMIKGPATAFGSAFEGVVVTKVVPHPTNPDICFVVTQGALDTSIGANFDDSAVWRTTDGGLTWEDVSVNLPAAAADSSGLFFIKQAPFSDFTIDPINPNVGYIAVGDPNRFNPAQANPNNGVYRTTNLLAPAGDVAFAVAFGGTGGASNIPGTTLGTIRAEVAPNRPSTVYATVAEVSYPAGLGGYRLYRSTDSGVNWTTLQLPAGDVQVTPTATVTVTSHIFNFGGYNHALVVDAQDSQRLYVAGRGAGRLASGEIIPSAVWASTDGGTTWQNISTGANGAGPRQVIRTLTRDAAGRLLAATDSGLFRYTLPAGGVTGGTWEAINGTAGRGLANAEISNVGLPPTNANGFVASSYGSGSFTFNDAGDPLTGPIPQFLFDAQGNKTTNPAYLALFSQSVNDPTPYSGNIHYDAVNPNLVYRILSRTNGGGAVVLRSLDAGLTWAATTAPPGAVSTYDQPAFEMDPSASQRLYVGTNKLAISQDGGNTWGNVIGLIGADGTATGNVTVTDPPLIGAGNVPSNVGAPGGPITAIGTSRSEFRIVYIATQIRGRTVTGGVQVFQPAIYRIDTSFPETPGTAYWRDVSPERRLTYYDPPPNPNNIIVGLNGLPGWVLPGQPLPQGLSATVVPYGYDNSLTGEVTDLVVDPSNANIVYATVRTDRNVGRVWRTDDGGDTWEDITGDLGNPAAAGGPAGNIVPYTVVLDPNFTSNTTDDVLYVGTTTAVWALTNPSGGVFQWARVGGDTGMPDVQVRDLKINTATGILAAATLGRGVWEYQIRPLVSGTVFEDVNGNGVRDISPITGAFSEPSRSGVVVGVFDLNAPGQPLVASTVTLGNGFYEFRSLPDGNYRVTVFGGLGGGEYQTTPQVPNPTFINKLTTIPGNVGPGGAPLVTPPADIGAFRLTSLSGVLYDDLNGNGVRDAGEPGRAGVSVRLRARDAGGSLITAVNPATGLAVPDVTTDATGRYTFTGLAPFQAKAAPSAQPPYRVNPYVVEPLLQSGVVPTGPAAPDLLLTSGVPLIAGTDIGTFTLVTISGTVFDDANGDGVRQGEPRLGGVTVRLLAAGADNKIGTADDVVLASQPSDPNGQYSFPNLGPGKYYVDELTGTLPPGGYRPTTPNPQGPIVPLSGQGLASPPRDPSVPALLGPFDFGNFRDAGLAGVVFEDDNGDGRRQPTETRPVVGATVILLDPGADGNSRTDADNTVLATATTDANGAYTFAGRQPLVLGNGRPYFTRVVQPSDLFVQTSADARAQLTSGVVTGGLNLGYFRRTSVSGFAFDDVNGNGVQDAGEPAAVNFPVSLLNSTDPSQVVATATTDATGQYRFTGLGPLQLNAAQGPGGAVIAYRIAVNLPNVVQTNAPGDLVLTSGVPAAGPTLALFRTVGFGGVVFDDTDGSGGRTAGEPGVAGVTVQLVTAGGQVALNPATGQPIQVTTAADGSYLIQAPNGTFTVQLANLPATTLTTTAVPTPVTTFSGQALPPIDLGVFRAFAVSGVIFDDTNGNGVRDAGENGLGNILVRLTTLAGLPTAFTASTAADGSYALPGVGPGTFLLAPVLPPGLFFTSPAGPVTLTATSGLVVPSPDVPTTFGVFRGAAVSGNVFEDLNRSGTADAGEPGAGGFTVQVVNGAGAVLASGVSDANGNYTVANVPAGAVAVQLAPRPGFLATLSPVPLGAPLLSGGSVTAGRLGGVRLGSVEGRVFSDGNRNGRPDNTEAGLVGVTVELVQNGNVVATRTSGENGFFQFLGLAAGPYTLRLNPGTLPAGRVQTGPQLSGLVYPVTVTEGTGTAGNLFAGLDFGVAGRKRYAVSADGGGGPRVQVYDAVTGVKVSDQFVYEESFTGGVRVASGDVNGDGVDDLVTVAGVGGGPRVRALDGVTGATLYDYFAYEPTFRLGLYVAAADVNGDGFADIITGTDRGGGPRVTVFSGRDGRQLLDFFAFDPEFRGGVRIGAGDIDGDGKAEVIAASGPGLDAEVRVFSADGRRVSTFNPLDAGYTGGLFVAGGATDPNTGVASVLVGTGAGFGDRGIAFVVDGLSGQPIFQLDAFPQGPDDPDTYRGDVRVAAFDTTGDSVPEIVIASGAGTRSQVRFLDGNNRREIATLNPFEAAFLGGLFIG